MSCCYHSNFSMYITGMLNMRHILGKSSQSYSYELMDFDHFCLNHYPDKNVLDKELALAWACKRNNEKESMRKVRISALRQLSNYMNMLGKTSYILSTELVEKIPQFEPYIFIRDELVTFFSIVDRIAPQYSGDSSEYTIPLFYRVAYGCGLRPNELSDLTATDYSYSQQLIIVRNSKKARDRRIILSDELNELCHRYDSLMKVLYQDRLYFFHIDSSPACRLDWFDYRLKKYWKLSGLDKRMNKCPRIYDFRHNFATNILAKWINESLDIMAFLPYLSTYMGHVQLHSTMYYVHLLPHQYQNSLSVDWNDFERLVPEVEHNEN